MKKTTSRRTAHKVDWGDGSVTGAGTHTYEKKGTYNVKVTGKLTKTTSAADAIECSMDANGGYMTVDEICSAVWGRVNASARNLVMVTLHRLRKSGWLRKRERSYMRARTDGKSPFDGVFDSVPAAIAKARAEAAVERKKNAEGALKAAERGRLKWHSPTSLTNYANIPADWK